MTAQASSCDLKELVRKFIPESIGKEIEKATSSIYPLQNVFIRKVKILKAPKFDLGKLMEACLLLYMLLIMCLMFWSLNYYEGFFHTIFISAIRIFGRFMYVSNNCGTLLLMVLFELLNFINSLSNCNFGSEWMLLCKLLVILISFAIQFSGSWGLLWRCWCEVG